MTVVDEEFEDLKRGIRDMVLLFKTIWDEVDHQFSELPREERHRIFSIIAPFLTDTLSAMVKGEDAMEDLTKPKGKRHGKKRR
ncbi:hypothetical protein IBX38_01660 [Candidatus Bathyarchaeota archaeon]|nr:hypothetical protein [Candidatus Bathyarchaeota archaeon]